MASNCLAPGYYKLGYTSNGFAHVQTVPIKPATSGAGMEIFQKNGTSVVWTTWIEAVLLVMKPFFNAADTFDSAEIFTQADCSSAPVYQDSYTPVITTHGSNSGADTPLVQAAFSFRTALGGRGKFTLIETTAVPDLKEAYSSLGSGAVKSMFDLLTSANSCAYGRDNSFLAVSLNLVTKTNDSLRKKRLHP